MFMPSGVAAAAASGKVTITPGSIVSDGPNAGRDVAWTIQPDSLCTQTIDGSATPYNPATDWIRPSTSNPAGYEVLVSATGDTGELTGDPLSTWLTLDTARSWGLVRAAITGVELVQLFISIRLGTVELVTGVQINLRIDNEG